MSVLKKKLYILLYNINSNPGHANIIDLPRKFEMFDLRLLKNSLSNYNVTIFDTQRELINNLRKCGLEEICNLPECIILGSDVVRKAILAFTASVPLVFNHSKIIILNTVPGDQIVASWIPDPRIFHKEMCKNIYITVKNQDMNDKDELINGRPKYHRHVLMFIFNLYNLGNLKNMPIYKYQITNNKFTRNDFFNHYKLDINKKLFIIYLAWPKNIYVSYFPEIMTNSIEIQFCENPELVDKCVTILNNLGYNVVFKVHPFNGLSFNPLKIGDYYKNYLLSENSKFKSLLSHKNIAELNKKHVFIENDELVHLANLYGDMGMLLSRSTSAWNSFLYNIPVLVISNKNRLFERQAKFIFKNNDRIKEIEDIIYGEIGLFEDLESDTENVLKNFIKKYSDKSLNPPIENHPVLGKRNFDIKEWVEYFDEIMNKPFHKLNCRIIPEIPNIAENLIKETQEETLLEFDDSIKILDHNMNLSSEKYKPLYTINFKNKLE